MDFIDEFIIACPIHTKIAVLLTKFFGSMKDVGNFLGRENRTKGFFAIAKKVVIFLGRQILKL